MAARAERSWPRALLRGLLLLTLGGCATVVPGPSARGAPPSMSGGELPAEWVRQIAPFSVLDEFGLPYDHPFLGGLVVPRIQFVDLRGDGRLDLFLQERSGELIHFENIGTATDPELVWRTDRFQGLDIGEWFLFADLDGDGTPELLAEERFSLIRVFRLVEGEAVPRFEAIPGPLLDVDGEPIFADRQNLPSVIDLDCDGLPDLFLGRVDGTIAHYRSLPRRTGELLPRFERVTDRFANIEIIGQIGTLHGANAMAWGDFTGDGHPDLLWGDFFEPGLLLLENESGCPTPSIRSEPSAVLADGMPIRTSGFNAPSLADPYGRGQNDLWIGVLGGAFNPNTTAAANLLHLRPDSAGALVQLTDRYLGMIDVGSESVVALGDLNFDGLPDLLVGSRLDPADQSRGRILHFRNIGSRGAPAFQLADTLSLAQSYHLAPALGALYGEEGTDLVLGTWNDGIHIHRGQRVGGEIAFRTLPDTILQIPRGSHTVPALGDLTGNGLSDLLVGQSSGALTFFRNVGSADSPHFEWVTDGYQGIDVGRRSAPFLIDLDGDGLPDLLLGSESGEVTLFRNHGTPAAPDFRLDPSFQLPLHPSSNPVLVDLDGDGVLELLSGGLSGGLQYYEGARGGTPPRAP